MESTWKGIKRLISIKGSPNIPPFTIIVASQSTTKSQEIANAFYKYFVNVASDIQSSINNSKNNFYDFLSPLNLDSFFPNPNEETEVENIAFSSSFKKYCFKCYFN